VQGGDNTAGETTSATKTDCMITGTIIDLEILVHEPVVGQVKFTMEKRQFLKGGGSDIILDDSKPQESAHLRRATKREGSNLTEPGRRNSSGGLIWTSSLVRRTVGTRKSRKGKVGA